MLEGNTRGARKDEVGRLSRIRETLHWKNCRFQPSVWGKKDREAFRARTPHLSPPPPFSSAMRWGWRYLIQCSLSLEACALPSTTARGMQTVYLGQLWGALSGIGVADLGRWLKNSRIQFLLVLLVLVNIDSVLEIEVMRGIYTIHSNAIKIWNTGNTGITLKYIQMRLKYKIHEYIKYVKI